MRFTFEVLGKLSIEPFKTIYKSTPAKGVRALSREIFGVLFPNLVDQPTKR